MHFLTRPEPEAAKGQAKRKNHTKDTTNTFHEYECIHHQLLTYIFFFKKYNSSSSTSRGRHQHPTCHPTNCHTSHHSASTYPAFITRIDILLTLVLFKSTLNNGPGIRIASKKILVWYLLKWYTYQEKKEDLKCTCKMKKCKCFPYYINYPYIKIEVLIQEGYVLIFYAKVPMY